MRDATGQKVVSRRAAFAVVIAVAVIAAVAVPTVSQGWWIFGGDKNPAQTIDMRGWVRCATINGGAAFPLELQLSRDDRRDQIQLRWQYTNEQTVQRIIQVGPQNSTYAYRVNIPEGYAKSTVHWTLICGAADGSSPRSEFGQYDVARSGGTERNICQQSGFTDYCTSPRLAEGLGGCVFGALKLGMTLDLAIAAAGGTKNPDGLDVVSTALGESNSGVLAAIGQWMCVAVTDPTPSPGVDSATPAVTAPPLVDTLPAPVPEPAPTLAVETTAPLAEPTDPPPTPTVAEPAPTTPPPPPTAAVPVPTIPPPPVTTVTVPATPAPPAAPTVSGFSVADLGGQTVRMSASVGWEAGADPITCNYLVDGGSVLNSQCGTPASYTFAIAPGAHTFEMHVCNRVGNCVSTGAVTQAIASPPPPARWTEIAWGWPGLAAPLFSSGPARNANGASGPATSLQPGTHITVSCRRQDQAAAPTNRDGWWYLISEGTYQGYWTPASMYENGDGPWPATGTSFDAAVAVC